MKFRIIASTVAALFAAGALSGCAGENIATTDEATIDASGENHSCEMIATDLAEYTAQLAEGPNEFSSHSPSTMLSFQQGAVGKLTTVSDRLENSGVKDALLKVRDAAAALIPPLEKVVADTDTWADGSMDAEIAEAQRHTADALADLGELCPGATGVSP